MIFVEFQEFQESKNKQTLINTELSKVERSIHAKGHSTAVDAAQFAKEVGAKCLVLNHISNRYDFLDDSHYNNAVNSIKELAAVRISIL